MKCPTCKGSGKFPGPYDVCPVCTGDGNLPNDRIDNPVCMVCSGTGKFPGPYDICKKCDGWGKLAGAVEEGPLVFFVQAGTPRTVHRKLQDIFSELNGDIRICDPYFGTASLAKLDLLTHCSSIRSLTAQLGANEKPFIIKQNLSDFVTEHNQITVLKSQGSTFHDRYILSKDELILLGHGLKDVGGKDSFIVRLGRHLAADTITSVSQAFEDTWKNAIPFP